MNPFNPQPIRSGRSNYPSAARHQTALPPVLFFLSLLVWFCFPLCLVSDPSNGSLTVYIVADLVHDFNINVQTSLQGLITFGQINRSFVVAGIGSAEGDPTDPQLFGGAAIAYVQDSTYNVSNGSPHPVYPLLTVRGVAAKGLDSSNAVQVIVSYLYSQISVDSTIWTIESSTYVEFLDTDQEYASASSTNGSFPALIPIKIDNYIMGWGTFQQSGGTAWNPPPQVPSTSGIGPSTFQEIPQPPYYGTISAPKVRRKWDYTKTIYSASDAMAFDAACDNYVNHINSAPFLGNTVGGTAQNMNKAAGTVYCYDAGISFNLASGQYIGRCTMIWRPEGWNPWIRYINPHTGVPPSNIWRPQPQSDAPGGIAPANGTKQAIEILQTDLNGILSLI
jgi:hypothetical protein